MIGKAGMHKWGKFGAFAASFILATNGSGQTLEFGDNVFRILECRQVHTYEFTANAGDRVIAHVTECNDFGGICSGASFAEIIALRDSDQCPTR